jgi:hypothetical protein
MSGDKPVLIMGSADFGGVDIKLDFATALCSNQANTLPGERYHWE